MKIEDLFKYGVTPTKGPKKGQKFSVESVDADGINAISGEDKVFFTHGEYDIWPEPKTLFEDDSIAPTWGNLKKAMEKAGISDDTEFAVQEDGFWVFQGLCRAATFTIETLKEVYGNPKKYIIVK